MMRNKEVSCEYGFHPSYADENLFIDPADIFTDYIKSDLGVNGLLNTSENVGSEKFFVSANHEDFIKNAEIFYKVKTLPELIKFA